MSTDDWGLCLVWVAEPKWSLQLWKYLRAFGVLVQAIAWQGVRCGQSVEPEGATWEA